MMIGTRERLRSSRHTSMPDTRGSITSSSTRSGSTDVEELQRLDAVAGDLDPEALACQADVSASTKDSSSSTTRTVCAALAIDAHAVTAGQGVRA